jgi:integrase
MAWVEKRQSGYLVRWRDEQGKKRQQLFREQADASDFAQSLRRRPNTRTNESTVSLSEYLEKTLGAAEDLRESTRYHYLSMARKHIAPAMGRRSLSEVDSDDVRRFLGSLRERGYSTGYRSVARYVLARAFKLAAREGLLSRNPLDAVPVQKPAARPEVEPLEIDDVEALASAILPRYRAAVLVMAYAGLRIGEVGALTISNVSLKGAFIPISGVTSGFPSRLLQSGTEPEEEFERPRDPGGFQQAGRLLTMRIALRTLRCRDGKALVAAIPT